MPEMTLQELTDEVTAQKETLQFLLERDRGQILLCAMDTPPEGCVPCDGTLYNIHDAANERLLALFKKIGNRYGGDGVNDFRVPLLGGEFVRIWDNGRGVDVGRALGSPQKQTTALPVIPFQADANGVHNHRIDGVGNHNHNHNLEISASRLYQGDGDQVNNTVAYPAAGPQSQTGNDGAHNHTLYEAGSHGHTISGGDVETRPRNVALAAFIRY